MLFSFPVMISIMAAASPVMSNVGFTNTVKGEMTYYIPNNGYGACGSRIGNYDNVAAVSHRLYDSIAASGSTVCGSCIQVKGSKGTIQVYVKDRCEGCKYYDVDLTQGAFAKIEDLSKGRVSVSWSPCSTSSSSPPPPPPPPSSSTPSSTRCGKSWVDANSKCGNVCKTDGQCYSGERCYADTSLTPCCAKQMLAGNYKTCAQIATALKVQTSYVSALSGNCNNLTSKNVICIKK